MEFEHILFDLDGTLICSHPGIVRGVGMVLEELGIYKSPKELLSFVGPPMLESFTKGCGLSMEEYTRAIERFRRFYETQGMFESEVYPGIPELLTRLQSAGKKLYVATSKPEPQARQLLEHFGLQDFFAFIGGSDGDFHGERHNKTLVMEYVLKNAGIAPGPGVCMVGDKSHDVQGAKNTGIFSIGVLYGYGSREELRAAGADRIFDRADEVGGFLFGEGE